MTQCNWYLYHLIFLKKIIKKIIIFRTRPKWIWHVPIPIHFLRNRPLEKKTMNMSLDIFGTLWKIITTWGPWLTQYHPFLCGPPTLGTNKTILPGPALNLDRIGSTVT
jgi:hypothetical protein